MAQINNLKNMEYTEKLRDRMHIANEGRECHIYLDNEPLFSKSGTMYWSYVRKLEDGTTMYEMIRTFDHKYFNLFTDDICRQLCEGVHRDNLTMNIPRQVEQVMINGEIKTI